MWGVGFHFLLFLRPSQNTLQKQYNTYSTARINIQHRHQNCCRYRLRTNPGLDVARTSLFLIQWFHVWPAFNCYDTSNQYIFKWFPCYACCFSNGRMFPCMPLANCTAFLYPCATRLDNVSCLFARSAAVQ
jgi:hypothetical protein